jgi:hypothetical protein
MNSRRRVNSTVRSLTVSNGSKISHNVRSLRCCSNSCAQICATDFPFDSYFSIRCSFSFVVSNNGSLLQSSAHSISGLFSRVVCVPKKDQISKFGSCNRGVPCCSGAYLIGDCFKPTGPINHSRRDRTNRWTGATGSVFRITRDPAKLVGSAVARSTQPLGGDRTLRIGLCDS